MCAYTVHISIDCFLVSTLSRCCSLELDSFDVKFLTAGAGYDVLLSVIPGQMLDSFMTPREDQISFLDMETSFNPVN